jgi:hypothetical protein
VELVAVNESGGCLTTLLGIVVASVLGAKGVQALMMKMAPYWPLIWPQLKFWAIVSLVVVVAYRCRGPVVAALERWEQRLEVEVEAREAETEMRAIHEQTVRQMERITRQRARR